MYNRYIPQPDGSYRRSRVPDASRPTPQSPPAAAHESAPPPCPPLKKEEAKPCPRQRQKQPQKEQPCRQNSSVSGFLKKLLPKDLDTADLMVVLLLLLMAADSEDQNTALLTLALYFFL
ncbi:MAG: hypothetical protein IJO56_00255 [Oscillospiraceae bacterium]|nr:hypothetical protein [Oscillospiraceae bacterium]